VEPGPALQELERAILRQDEALEAPMVAPPAPRRPLPAPPTPLVGRRLEVAAVDAMLRRDECRLVTLTGPGGTGKTRLALAAAAELADELRDGAAFVDLSSVTDEALVLPTVARALDLGETDDPLAYLRERSILLVLDNLEQLGEGVAPVAELLAAAPRLRILATSRTPLRLSAEHEYPVPPLPVPAEHRPFEELATNDAVRLFTVRAQAADPAFALSAQTIERVAAICRRLDGLPLALELAAARTRSLPVAAIEERVTRALELLVEGARDLPQRQRTLRATLDWSYGLLAPGARQLLARVSIFAGGWTLADLEAVVGDEALALGALVDASLVRRRGERYVLLETVREYGLERLRERGEEDDLRRRHALHFIEVAENARTGILAGGDASERGLAVLGEEQDNLRAALAWTIEADDAERELALCNAQRWFWIVSGAVTEGRRAFAHAVETTAASGGALHALALHGDATFAVKQGHFDEARPTFEQALAVYRALDDWEWVGRCCAELGSVAVAVGDLDRAVELYEECVRLFDEHGDDQKRAIAVANLGAIAAQRDDFETAVAYGREAIELQRRGDNRDDLAVTLCNLSRVLLALGELDEARAALRESLELATRLGYRLVLAYALGGAAEVAAQRDDPETAARLLGGSAGLFEAMGMTVPTDEVREQERTRVHVLGLLGASRFAELLAVGHSAPADALVDEALAITR
jgi:predicted ATPase